VGALGPGLARLCLKTALGLGTSVRSRAGKNLRFFRKKLRFLGFLGFFRFLGFNVRKVARGTLDTGIKSRRRPIHEG